jgi:gamma-glutamylcyclotransferase (GGCT)/AIG2-like uncharacterized protein YtfP
MKVFVYGTLMQGEHNAGLLDGSEYLGGAHTGPDFRLLNLGYYPAAIEEGQTEIVGELYQVDRATLERLDRLEGVPHLYRREKVELDGGETAWIYLINPARVDRQTPEIATGDWRSR